MNIRFFLYAILPGLLLAVPIRAQDQSDGTLHIVRPIIDAVQDTAGLCLEFDHPLDPASRGAVIAGTKLESGGKAEQLTAANVSLASALLCFQSLQYRQDYTLTLENAKGAKGEKLTEPYRLSFTVPDRPPSLAFTGTPASGDLARYQGDDPVIRAINIPRVHIVLYRLTDPAAMASAWRQRRQTTLAPSESIFFARDKGQLVWEGDLVLKNEKDDKAANRSVEYSLPLRAAAGSLAPGLYLAAATGPRSAASTSELAPMAAQWFAISDLEIKALAADEGFHVLAEKTDASSVVKGVHFIAASDRALSESHSGPDGLTFLPLAGEKRAEASVLVGVAPGGGVDFLDLKERDADRGFALPNLQAKLSPDRAFYHPGSDVHLTLTARNLYSDAVATPGSTLQLLRLDRSLYAALPVNEGRAGVSYISFPAPPANGAWPVVWQRPDGQTLAEGIVRVSENDDAPRFEITADRMLLEKDGDVVLAVKSVADSGKPASYAAGHIVSRWTEPSVLADWPGYSFGAGGNDESSPVPLAAFTTDAGGAAQVRLALKTPAGGASLHAATLVARSDPAAGALDSGALSLPFKPEGGIVGVRPLAREGKFAENSVARFDVIALDGEGKRRDASGLEYQIYEEGRSFDWYQAEGRWQYKPLQQRRRIGGGALNLKAAGPASIGWPVTAGSYTLEITDEGGNLVNRFPFDAGWNLPRQEKEPEELSLSSAASYATAGETATVKFTLDKPAVVTAVVADDRIRKIIHQAMPEGDGRIEFKAEEEWGSRVRVQVGARKAGDNGISIAQGSVELPVRHNQKELSISADIPAHAESGKELVLPVTVANAASPQAVTVSLLAVPESAKDGGKTPGAVLLKDISPGGDGKAEIRLPVPDFSGNLHVKLMAASPGQWGRKEFSFNVRPALAADLALPAFLRAGDMLRLSLTLKNYDAPAGGLGYTLSASDSLKLSGALKGKVDLAPGQSRTLVFEVRALEDGKAALHLGFSDAHGSYGERSWPLSITGGGGFSAAAREEIAPQKTWQLPAQPKDKEKMPGLLILSAVPLDGVMEGLKALVEAGPFASESMAEWLEAARLWQAEIAKIHLLPEDALQARRGEMLQRLLARQNADGGFPSLPGNASDLIPTAEVLVALERSGEARAKPAADQAAAWLHRRLENTWFDEKERPARAAVFPALAATGRLDVAALRYFAETSADKNLPPLAAAQLAAALAAGNENDKASFWLKSLQDKTGAPELLPLLAENPLFDPHALIPALQKLGGAIAAGSARDPRAIAYFLRAFHAAADRAGAVQASVNGEDKNQPGLLVLDTDRRAALAVRNPMDRPLYALAGRIANLSPTAGNGIERHIVRFDGAAAGSLEESALYAVHLQGPWPADAAGLLVHDAPGPGLEPVTCALASRPGSAENSGQPGLCEKTDAGVDAFLPAPEEGTKDWQVIYLARAAHSGDFTLAPAAARSMGGNSWLRSGEEKIEIR